MSLQKKFIKSQFEYSFRRIQIRFMDGSVISRNGSADPDSDPNQNETEPLIFTVKFKDV